jgi:hypothetical protein
MNYHFAVRESSEMRINEKRNKVDKVGQFVPGFNKVDKYQPY